MKTKVSKIGGQAVIEGVMMRGEKSMATACRTEQGIQIDSDRITVSSRMKKIGKIPIIRGVVNFCNMLYLGTKTIMSSTEIQGEGMEPSKFEKWLSDKFNIDAITIAVWIGTILGVALAVGLFFILPQVFVSLLEKIPEFNAINMIVKNLIEGLIRIVMFVLYVLLVSQMKEIKRVFMYHGAEHKTINCYESGKPLTIENIRASSRIHNRCGTTFMFIVMIVSIILFSLCGWDPRWWVRLLIRLALIPAVMGVSYEILKLLAKYDNWFVNFLRGPGLLLQGITTANPDDDMIMVALASFKTVLEMDKDDTIEPVHKGYQFDYKEVKDIVSNKIDIKDYDEEFNWICCYVKGVNRAELLFAKFENSDVASVLEYCKKLSSNMPLDYILGESEFYMRKYEVNPSVLIPRPETELLVEQSLKVIKEGDKVLDLCTGSGCIATTISAEKGIKVFASDISQDALNVARKNASKNNADVEFIHSDLFSSIQDKFDVIVSNPPYIRSDEIKTLDNSVKDYEPVLALDGGKSGLDMYVKIITSLNDNLNEGGSILFECGYDQAEFIKNMLTDFSNVDIVKDYNNIERIIIAKGYKNV